MASQLCAHPASPISDNAARVIDLELGVRVPQPPPIDTLTDTDVLQEEDGATIACDEIEALIR